MVRGLSNLGDDEIVTVQDMAHTHDASDGNTSQFMPGSDEIDDLGLIQVLFPRPVVVTGFKLMWAGADIPRLNYNQDMVDSAIRVYLGKKLAASHANTGGTAAHHLFGAPVENKDVGTLTEAAQPIQVLDADFASPESYAAGDSAAIYIKYTAGATVNNSGINMASRKVYDSTSGYAGASETVLFRPVIWLKGYYTD